MVYDFIYYKFVDLPATTKEYHGIKQDATNPRYDCVASAGRWEGQTHLTTTKGASKGQMKFTKTDPRNFVHIDPSKMGNFSLKGLGNINVTSVHIKTNVRGRGGELIGTGEPPASKELKNGKLNRLYECRNDGFVFIVSPDFKGFEMLVFKNGRNVVQSISTMIVQDPKFWVMLEKKRQKALPFWHYFKA